MFPSSHLCYEHCHQKESENLSKIMLPYGVQIQWSAKWIAGCLHIYESEILSAQLSL